MQEEGLGVPEALPGKILRLVSEVDDLVLQQFDCGSPDLNAFLADDSKDYLEHGLTSTYVVFEEDAPGAVIGYFSLSADAIRLNLMERGDLGLPFQHEIEFFPAIKVTKLAVAVGRQSEGIGRGLLNMIIGLAYGSQHAVRLLNVNAVNNERTLKFYADVGFLESLDAQEKKLRIARGQAKRKEEQPATVLMYLDIFAE